MGVGASNDAPCGRASHSDPDSTQARAELARRLFEREKAAEAILLLKAAAWLDEQSSLPHLYLANIHYVRGEHELALLHQRRAVERSPGNAIYRQNLAALERQVGR
ncbi:MAG TPA: hypothetical protein VM534_03285 [Thermoanaerobaculia bacterium]|nr:hypothetical protein [Thermoanaerobaculia bacterium]